MQNFSFQLLFWNKLRISRYILSHCHSLIQKSFSFDDVAVATVKGNNEKKRKMKISGTKLLSIIMKTAKHCFKK